MRQVRAARSFFWLAWFCIGLAMCLLGHSEVVAHADAPLFLNGPEATTLVEDWLFTILGGVFLFIGLWAYKKC